MLRRFKILPNTKKRSNVCQRFGKVCPDWVILKVLGDKSNNKSSPNIWQLFGLFWKTIGTAFCIIFGRVGKLFIKTSNHNQCLFTFWLTLVRLLKPHKKYYINLSWSIWIQSTSRGSCRASIRVERWLLCPRGSRKRRWSCQRRSGSSASSWTGSGPGISIVQGMSIRSPKTNYLATTAKLFLKLKRN